MGLLRKHIRDDASRRVPLYRTGLWPWRLPHEQALSRAEQAELGWTPRNSFDFWVEFAGRVAATVAPGLLGYYAIPVITSNASGRVSLAALGFAVVAFAVVIAGALWCLS